MYFQNIQNREWTKAGQVPLGKIGEHDRASPAGRDASSDDAKNTQRLAARNEFPLAASRSAPMIFTSEEIAR
jgi:hypothetical protein